MVSPPLPTLMSASLQQECKFKGQVNTLKEMRDRKYRENGRRTIKKIQDKTGSSIPTVCELFV